MEVTNSYNKRAFRNDFMYMVNYYFLKQFDCDESFNIASFFQELSERIKSKTDDEKRVNELMEYYSTKVNSFKLIKDDIDIKMLSKLYFNIEDLQPNPLIKESVKQELDKINALMIENMYSDTLDVYMVLREVAKDIIKEL